MLKRMMTFIFLGVLLMMFGGLIIVQADQTAQPAPYNNDCYLRSSGDFARVRADFNTDAEEVTRIGKDDPVAYLVLGRNASNGYTWYLINYGWVRADVVTLEGNCANLPTLTEKVSTGFNSNLYPCPTDYNAPGVIYLAPRLQAGMSDVRPVDTGQIYYIYDTPDAGSRPRAFTSPGDTLTINSGPFCDDGYVFWEVTYGQLVGFAPESEYFTGTFYLVGGGGSAASAQTNPNPPSAENPPSAQPVAGSADPAARYTTNGMPVRNLLYGPNGIMLAVSTDSASSRLEAQVWNLSSGGGVTLPLTQAPAAFTFASGGAQLLMLDIGGVLSTWNAGDGTRLTEMPLVNAPVVVVGAFSTDGQLVAATSCADEQCTTNNIEIFSTATGELRRTITLESVASSLAISPRGGYIAVNEGGPVRLYNLETGERMLSYGIDVLTVSRVSSLVFSADGGLLAIAGCSAAETDVTIPCSAGAVQVFNSAGNISFGGLAGNVRDVAFAPDGLTMAVVTDTRITLHETATGDIQRTIEGVSTTFRSAAFSPDGRLIVGGDEGGTIYFWVR